MRVKHFGFKLKWAFYLVCVATCIFDKPETTTSSQWLSLSEQVVAVANLSDIEPYKTVSDSHSASLLNLLDLAVLADVVYGNTPSPDRWKPYTRSGNNDVIGLKIQAYINKKTGVIIVAVAGADPSDMEDLKADLDFAFGGYHPQFRMAVEYVNEVMQLAKEDAGVNNIVITGHSLGGGIAQVLSHTFHLSGATFDAPASNAIVSHPEYSRHLRKLGLKEQGIGPQFTNYTEHGSLFSGIVRSGYLGREVQLDLSEESMKVAGLGAFFMQHYLIKVVGTLLLVFDQLGPDGQHSLGKFARNFSEQNNKPKDKNDNTQDAFKVFALNKNKANIQIT